MSYLELARQARRRSPIGNEPKRKEPAPLASTIQGISTARAVQRDSSERRLLAAGWAPKDHCGPKELSIWANPETGFCYSQGIALHCLSQGVGGRA